MTGSGELASIIITTYMRNHLLLDAIESAIEQKYEPIEIVVVDDSGTAEARSVVDKYASVKYVPMETNQGLMPARQVGFENSSGRYVQFLDDDDVLHPDKISRQVPLFTDETGVVYSGFEYQDSSSEVLPQPDARGEVLAEALSFQLFPPCCNGTRLHDRSVLEAIQPFKDVAADDEWTMIELARRTKFDFVDDSLITLGDSDDYSLGKSLANVNGRWELLKRFSNVYHEHSSEVRNTAVANTYKERGDVLLNQDSRTFSAMYSYLLALYYTPDDRFSQFTNIIWENM